MNDKNSFWNQAAKAGLVLGGVSALYLMVTYLLGLINSSGFVKILLSVVGALLWAAKFAACVYLMKSFIQKFANGQPEESGGRKLSAFSYGALVSFLSALIYSAVYLAYNTYIVPEIFDQLMESYRNMPIMTSETLETIEQIMPKMPTIMFFSNLIYCTLFGIIVTAFVSKNTESSNPFKN